MCSIEDGWKKIKIERDFTPCAHVSASFMKVNEMMVKLIFYWNRSAKMHIMTLHVAVNRIRTRAQ